MTRKKAPGRIKGIISSISYSIMILMFSYSTYNFFIGFHNADMCQNWSRINRDVEKYGMEYIETDWNGEYIRVDDCYREGIKSMIISYAIAWMFSLYLVMSAYREKKRRREPKGS